MVGNLILRFPEGKSKALTFSYDDGVPADKRLVEIFRKNGLKGTFNLNSGLFGKGNRLDIDEVKATYTPDVCEIACHGVTHAAFSDCDSAVLMSQVVYDRKALEGITGYPVFGMAYPFGNYSENVINALKNCNIKYARTVDGTQNFSLPRRPLAWNPTCHHKNPNLMKLADDFLNTAPRRNPLLFYVWGHAYEFDDDNNWDIIESFAEKMSGRQDIWYATNIEILNCIEDFNRLQYSADGTLIYNPNARDVWVAPLNGEVFVIKSGETYKRG